MTEQNQIPPQNPQGPSEFRNPALVPDPPELQEKQYIVTGTQPVFDHAPGEVFTAKFTPEQEKAYTEYGHLAVVENGEWEGVKVTEQEEVTPVEGDQPAIVPGTEDK